MIRFHRVFAPNAKLRSELVPKKEPRKLLEHSAAELGEAEQSSCAFRFERVLIGRSLRLRLARAQAGVRIESA